MNIPWFLTTRLSVPAFTGAGKVKYLCISTGRELLRQLNFSSQYPQQIQGFPELQAICVGEHYGPLFWDVRRNTRKLSENAKKTRKQKCCLGKATGPSLSLGLSVTRKPDTG